MSNEIDASTPGIPFTEKLGKLLVEQLNLAQSTYNRWKSEGVIPQKYAGYHEQPANFDIEVTSQKMLQVLDLGIFKINKMVSVSAQKFRDVRRGHTKKFTYKEYQLFKAEVEQIIYPVYSLSIGVSQNALAYFSEVNVFSKSAFFGKNLASKVYRGTRLTDEEKELIQEKAKQLFDKYKKIDL